MSAELFIARRYLRSNRRNGFLSFITNFAVLGITLGTAALIITLSVLDGFEREIKSKVVEFSSHIQVTGFQNLPLRDYAATMRLLAAEVPGIASITPFVAKEGMIRVKEGVDGVYLVGVDASDPSRAPSIHLVEGRYLTGPSSAEKELVIGKKLAVKLNAAVGDKAVIFALPENQSGKAKAMQCTIRGIYESGMAEFDDIYAYTNLGTAQDFLQLPGEVSGFDIAVSNIGELDSVAVNIQSKLEYPHFVRTIYQRYKNLFSWVALQKKLSPILLSLIILVATINIVGTLLMFVLEKTKSIGVLKTLGAPPNLIKRIFVLQGMAIGAAGVVLGNLLAWGLCALQLHYRILTLPSEIYYMDTVPIVLSPFNFAAVSAIALALCFLTTLLPSRAAAGLSPVTALRFG